MQTKTIFACEKCGAQSMKWAGRCVECGVWGTMHEEQRHATSATRRSSDPARVGKTMALGDVKTSGERRVASGIGEVDRVLGGGIPPGAVILLAGEPGIGKSTLVAQIAQNLCRPERNEGPLPNGSSSHSREILRRATPQNDVLYVSGEESPEQLRGRFDRLLPTPYSLLPINILTDTNAETVATTIEATKPALAIIDSVQTLTADAAEEAGALTRLRAGTAIVAEAAKRTNVPVLLIGQVTKSLDIAGPKSLEHLVDIVLTFEGDRYGNYRILRAAKNRFGATDEIGVFEMTTNGLREVKNPSAAFLQTRSASPGSVVTCVLEGSRPILVEVQALATRSHFPYPERRASGFDPNRLNMLLAVLTKSCKLKAESYDIHVNITGGFKIREPAADLAVLLAIVSSLTDRALPEQLLAFGEVGLGGELRPVRDPARRINEAKKLGFTSYLLPGPPSEKSAGTQSAGTVQDAFKYAGLS